LTIAAAGAGIMPSSDAPGERRNTDEEQIRERRHTTWHSVHNSQRASHVVLALSDALWKRQTSPKQHRYRYEARRTWDTLGNAPKVKVPTLILCGADDEVNRGGRTPVRPARRLAELVPDSELALVPNVKRMTFWDGDGALSALENFLQQ
jgi:pimeloyl-ACP methyl ester carboxylesterase